MKISDKELIEKKSKDALELLKSIPIEKFDELKFIDKEVSGKRKNR